MRQEPPNPSAGEDRERWAVLLKRAGNDQLEREEQPEGKTAVNQKVPALSKCGGAIEVTFRNCSSCQGSQQRHDGHGWVLSPESTKQGFNPSAAAQSFVNESAKAEQQQGEQQEVKQRLYPFLQDSQEPSDGAGAQVGQRIENHGDLGFGNFAGDITSQTIEVHTATPVPQRIFRGRSTG